MVVTEAVLESSILDFFEFIGEDYTREGLKDTPKRVIKAWKEIFSGYRESRESILCTTFQKYGEYDSIISLKDIEFTSYCEHHLLPFIGKAAIGYLPAKGDSAAVVGLSKLARLVDMHAKRLQIQEKMTFDIAHDLHEVLNPRGVGVVIQSHHSCMGCRGVKKPDAAMITSHVTGSFRDDPVIRQEWFNLLRM